MVDLPAKWLAFNTSARISQLPSCDQSFSTTDHMICGHVLKGKKVAQRAGQDDGWQLKMLWQAADVTCDKLSQAYHSFMIFSPPSKNILPPCRLLGSHAPSYQHPPSMFQGEMVPKFHEWYIVRFPSSTSFRWCMSHPRHVTLSLANPSPLPNLLAFPPARSHLRGSPVFCEHPLIFRPLSAVEIPAWNKQ